MLLGFKKQFADNIKLGRKVFTLRKRRKIQPKIGERLYMYTGLQTKQCELISNKEVLCGIQQVRLTIELLEPRTHNFRIKVWVDGRLLRHGELSQFVIYDGFWCIEDWAFYWLDGKTRTGASVQLFHWTDLKY